MSVRYGARYQATTSLAPQALAKDADGCSTLASRNARGLTVPLCLPHYLA